jgi:predicted Zn finger-like uncharacterized protein
VQANCPQCQTRIQIDDAKVPDRPFNVKCPKCGNVVKLPGRPAAVPPSSNTEAPVFSEEALRQATGAPPLAAPGERALVSFPDPGLAQSVAQTLTRLGYATDVVGMDDGARILEQGIFAVAATARIAAPQGKESLYQRLTRSSPEARRKIFVILAGDEFKTGDGTQAWAVLADLVLAPRDVPMADNAVRTVMGERNRLYQVYIEAKRRHDESFLLEK